MKNSGWNHSRWSKKMDELLINEDVNASWSEMQSILDKSMPLLNPASGSAGAGAVKTIGSKIVSLLGYILPAAAMVSVITYLAVKELRPLETIAKRTTRKERPFKQSPAGPLASVNEIPTDSMLWTDTASYLKTTPEAKSASGTVHLKKAAAEPSKKGMATDLPESDALESSVLNTSQSTGRGRSLPSTADAQLMIPALPDTLLDQRLLLLQQQGIAADNQGYIAAADPATERTALQIKTDRKNTKKDHSINLAARFTAGAGTGINIYKSGTTFFLEGTAGYAINQKININIGVRTNTARTIKGVYSFQNYKPADSSIQHLSAADSRKLTIIDIPLNLGYQISDKISLKAGPVISFNVKETRISSRLDTATYYSGIIYDLQRIKAVINDDTRTSRIAIGFSAGLGLHIRRFDINTGYLKNLKPFRASNDLGSYKNAHNSFQLGIRYNFK